MSLTFRTHSRSALILMVAISFFLGTSLILAVPEANRVFGTLAKAQDSPWGRVALVWPVPTEPTQLEIGGKTVFSSPNESAIEYLVLPKGVLLLTYSQPGGYILTHQVYFYDGNTGELRTLVNDGHYHQLYAAAPAGDAVLLTTAPPEREFLLHSQAPKRGDHWVSCLDLAAKTITKIAELHDWERLAVRWSADSEKVGLYGMMGDSYDIYLASWDRRTAKLALLYKFQADVQDFLPLPDGSMAFSGTVVSGGAYVTGVFVAQSLSKEPTPVETDVVVTGPLSLDPATGKVRYESRPLEARSTTEFIPENPKARSKTLAKIAYEEREDAKGKSLWLAGKQVAPLDSGEKVADGAETSEGHLFFIRRLDKDNNVKDRLLLASKTGQAREVGSQDRFFDVLEANLDSSEVVLLSHPADYAKRPPKVDQTTLDLRLVLLNLKTDKMTNIVAPMAWGGSVKVRWSQDREILCAKTDQIYRWTRQTGTFEPVLKKMFQSLDFLPISGNRVVLTGMYFPTLVPGAKSERGLFLATASGDVVSLDPSANASAKILDFDEATQTVRYQDPFPSSKGPTAGIRSLVIPKARIF